MSQRCARRVMAERCKGSPQGHALHAMPCAAQARSVTVLLPGLSNGRFASGHAAGPVLVSAAQR